MKKLLIGCAIFFVIACIAVCGCTMCIGYKTKKWTENIAVAVEKTSKLEAEFPFDDPGLAADADPARFADYMAIRQGIIDRTAAAPLFGKLILAAKNNTQPNIGMGDIFGFLGDLPKLIDDFGTILRSKQMSMSEYSWHARVVLKAIHDGALQEDAELKPMWLKLSSEASKIQTEIDRHYRQQPPQQQVDVDLEALVAEIDGTPARPANIALLKEHLEKFSGSPDSIWVEIVITSILSETLPQMLPPGRF